MRKPTCLDLFCGAGGASVGLSRAGFEVIGVDIAPQPHYPFQFHLADALVFPLDGCDCYWASPPCQAYSLAGIQWRSAGREYPDLIAATRERLQAMGKPYVIENVPGAPLRNPVVLNAAMFDLNIRRTRWFETSFPMPLVMRPWEGMSGFKMGRKPDGRPIVPVGHFSGVAAYRELIRLPRANQAELAQAIPPAYAEFLAKYMAAALPGVWPGQEG